MRNDSDDSPQFALAFETSCAIGEVAIVRGESVLRVVRFGKPRAHTTEFLPAIETLCKECDATPEQVRAVYVSVGPGSFTGLRIGVTAAKMIAYAHGAAVVAVPTLEIIAQNALTAPSPPAELAVVLDAKRKRVFAGAFELRDGVYVPTVTPAEVDPKLFLEARSPNCHILGEGVLYHRDAIEASGRPVLDESFYQPCASVVASLGYQMARRGEFADAPTLTPVYIRPPEAEEKWAQRQAENTN